MAGVHWNEKNLPNPETVTGAQAKADAALQAAKAYADTLSQGGDVHWDNILGKPSVFPPASHSHMEYSLLYRKGEYDGNGGNYQYVHVGVSRLPALVVFRYQTAEGGDDDEIMYTSHTEFIFPWAVLTSDSYIFQWQELGFNVSGKLNLTTGYYPLTYYWVALW